MLRSVTEGSTQKKASRGRRGGSGTGREKAPSSVVKVGLPTFWNLRQSGERLLGHLGIRIVLQEEEAERTEKSEREERKGIQKREKTKGRGDCQE